MFQSSGPGLTIRLRGADCQCFKDWLLESLVDPRRQAMRGVFLANCARLSRAGFSESDWNERNCLALESKRARFVVWVSPEI